MSDQLLQSNRELQQANLTTLTEEEQNRYKKAYQSFREELTAKNGHAVAKEHAQPAEVTINK